MGEPDSWWQLYIPCFEALEHPMLLADANGTLCWANACACAAGLDTAYANAAERYLFFSGDSTIFDKISRKATILIPREDLLSDGQDFLLTPILSGEIPQGCVVTLRRRSHAPGERFAAQAQQRLSIFSGQLRGPLSTIFSALSGITRQNGAEYGDPDLQEYVSRISVQCYRLLRTSMHVTQFHRYEYGLAPFAPQMQDLTLFMEQLCRVVTTAVATLGIHFSYLGPDVPLPALFDADVISDIILELISNAAKFIGENGVISVTLQTAGERATICVADNGLGMAPQLLPLAFEPYFSRDPRTENICGDGLGLCLCQRGARLHGGGIALHSQEGEGTRVVFSLPLRQDAHTLRVRDMGAEFLFNRFSNLFVILADVCKAPEQ